MKVRSIITVAATAAIAGGFFAGPASAFNPTPEPPRVIPLDGAHWQAGAGLPDPTNQSSIGLVQDGPTTPDTHVLVASIHHVPASLTELGFTSQTPSGINPCWKVAVTNPDGSTFTLHLTTDSARGVSGSPSGGDFAPIVQWTWTLNLPAGDQVTSATAELMTGGSPSAGGQASFDRFTVNGEAIGTP